MSKHSKTLVAISISNFLVFGLLLGFQSVAQTPTGTLTLEDCLKLAVRQNPRAKVALAGINEAMGLTTAAKSGFIPSLTFNGFYQYRENDFGDAVDLETVQREITFVEQFLFALENPGAEFPSVPTRGANLRRETYDLTLRLSQNIYSGGRVRAQVAAAKLEEQEQFYAYQSALNEVILETRLAFYEVLRAQANVDIQKQALGRQRAEVEFQQSQLDAGTIGELNVLRAEVALASVQPTLISAEIDYETALLQLAEVLAIEPDPDTGAVPIRPLGDLGIVAPSIDLPNALGKATAIRPELKAQRKLIEQLQQRVTIARSAVLPSIEVFATYEFYSELDKNQPNANTSTYTAGITGTWRIFDGLRAHGQMQAVRAQIDAANHELDRLTLLVRREVRTAFIAYEGALKAYAEARKAASLASVVFKSTEDSYKQGLSSQLEVLRSQDQLTDAASQVLEARYDLNEAIALLDAAIGTT